MKVFRVITEKDGETTKLPGNVTADIIQTDYRYAAEEMGQVLEAINRWIDNEEETVMAIIEEHPAITILERTYIGE